LEVVRGSDKVSLSVQGGGGAGGIIVCTVSPVDAVGVPP
jgi:hypothetical protein